MQRQKQTFHWARGSRENTGCLQSKLGPSLVVTVSQESSDSICKRRASKTKSFFKDITNVSRLQGSNRHGSFRSSFLWKHDGPDGFQHYWQRDPAWNIYMWNGGGGVIMVWAAFSFNRTMNLQVVFIELQLSGDVTGGILHDWGSVRWWRFITGQCSQHSPDKRLSSGGEPHSTAASEHPPHLNLIETFENGWWEKFTKKTIRSRQWKTFMKSSSETLIEHGRTNLWGDR